MCLLEVAMCEKCRRSHFQSDGVSKKFEDLGEGRGVRNFRTGEVTNLGEGTFAGWGGGSVPHYMPCITYVMDMHM